MLSTSFVSSRINPEITNPWKSNGTFNTIVLAENNNELTQACNDFLEYGAKNNDVVWVLSGSKTASYESFSNIPCLKIDASKPISLNPFSFINDCEFEDFENLFKSWICKIGKLNDETSGYYVFSALSKLLENKKDEANIYDIVSILKNGNWLSFPERVSGYAEQLESRLAGMDSVWLKGKSQIDKIKSHVSFVGDDESLIYTIMLIYSIIIQTNFSNNVRKMMILDGVEIGNDEAAVGVLRHGRMRYSSVVLALTYDDFLKRTRSSEDILMENFYNYLLLSPSNDFLDEFASKRLRPEELRSMVNEKNKNPSVKDLWIINDEFTLF